MKNVILLGELGKKYGRRFRLNVKTPAEAVRALCANFSDFEKFVCDSQKRNVGYRVIVGKSDIDLDDLHTPSGQDRIVIVPVVMGAGWFSNAFKIVVGVALIAAAFWNPLAFYGGTALLTGAAATLAVSVGASLILSGVSNILTQTPKNNPGADDTGTQTNKTFDGALNVQAQGNPVPVGYGRLIVGSAIISGGIDTVRV